MKIKYVQGDLFQTEVKHILHGCNDQGVMGSGVAYHIRNKFPKAYTHYLDQDLELGKVFYVDCGEKIIINAISQADFGRNPKKYVSYDAIDLIMKKVDEDLFREGFEEVAMPKIGAGLGGGNWNIIESIIETNMKLVRPIVYFLD